VRGVRGQRVVHVEARLREEQVVLAVLVLVEHVDPHGARRAHLERQAISRVHAVAGDEPRRASIVAAQERRFDRVASSRRDRRRRRDGWNVSWRAPRPERERHHRDECRERDHRQRSRRNAGSPATRQARALERLGQLASALVAFRRIGTDRTLDDRGERSRNVRSRLAQPGLRAALRLGRQIGERAGFERMPAREREPQHEAQRVEVRSHRSG
jgi:hypothetical protein